MCVCCLFIWVRVVKHKVLCVLCACAYMCVCAHVCLNTYAHVLGPRMYPPAGNRHGALVGSSRSGRRRETAGHWCWRFGSECGACYGRTTLLPSAVQSHRHRKKLERETLERDRFSKRETENTWQNVYVFKCGVHCLLQTFKIDAETSFKLR